MKEYIRISVDQLREMVERMENEQRYHNMCGIVYATIQHHPNGNPILEFEQPCSYADCNSTFYRFDGPRTSA